MDHPSGSQCDHIVEAALYLIGKQGADHVDPMAVIKHLGISRTEMRACFPDEHHFWDAVVQKIEAQMRTNWDAVLASDQSSLGQLRSLVAAQVGLIMGVPAVSATLFSQRWRTKSPELRNALLGIRKEFYKTLLSIVEQARSAGEVPVDLDSDKVARQIIETFQGSVTSWALTADATRSIAEVWEKVMQIVTAPTSRRSSP